MIGQGTARERQLLPSRRIPVSSIYDPHASSRQATWLRLMAQAAAVVALNDSSGDFEGEEYVYPPIVSVGDVTREEGNEGGTDFIFTVTLSGAATTTVAVAFFTADGTATAASGDYEAVSLTLTFAPGETFPSRSIAGRCSTRFTTAT